VATNSELRDRFAIALGADVRTEEAFGELTVFVEPGQLLDALRAAKNDDVLACELLADVSGVHWPAGEKVIERQPSTSGWPDYRITRDEGVIEVLYVLRSLSEGHHVRLAVRTPDTDPSLPSSTEVYPQAANFHEREVFDMFGVVFEGHPKLERILMPEDWIGHPHRKDYPLGGVEIPYKNDKHIPPPNERDIREVAPSGSQEGSAS
jgi:NADH-quinone oxidoreductase subunit C